MKHLYSFAFWFAAGYVVVTKLAPAIQAKIESMDIDEMWDVFNNNSDWEVE